MNTAILKPAFISLCIGGVIQFISFHIQSTFIFEFLKANITNLQVALLAVNTATLGIVLTKIREIIEKTDQRPAFDSVRSEMLLSIKEQVFLIAISLIVLALESAKNTPISVPAIVFHATLTASFVYSITILYDTAKSVFVILDY